VGGTPHTPTRARPAWLTAPVLLVSVLSVATGIAMFSVTAVIGDVAATFGAPTDGDDPAAQIGLPATTVGIALTIIRLSSLGSLPAAALADQLGRRRLLLLMVTIGLGLTALAAASPGFWWYVALVSLSRPALSTVNALAGVVAAEESKASDRTAAIALITAAYGIGSGIVSVGRGLLPGEPSFRVVTAFVLVPLVLLPLIARGIREPRIAQSARLAQGMPGAVPRGYRRNVAIVALLAGGIALATGPGFTYLFVYGERILGASPLYLSMLVVAAGPTGLAGLLFGRWAADHLGRRITAGAMMATTGLAVLFGYSAGTGELAVGYLGTIFAASAFAPAEGAIAAELVPTRVRATMAGWMTVCGVLGASIGLTVVGVLADVTGSFATATATIGIVVVVAALGFATVPETKGTELESLESAE
jgi:MFS family permease